jgi:hypothetical protein
MTTSLPVTDTSAVSTAPAATVPAPATGATPDQTSSNSTTLKRVLLIAAGIGVAYLIYKQMPQGRRYMRLESM